MFVSLQSIPDPSFIDDDVRMFGSWFGMSNICIFPTKISGPSNNQNSSGDDKTERNIIHLKHKTMLFDPKVRQLVNESSGVFQELQTNVDDPTKSTDALYYSRKYRLFDKVPLMLNIAIYLFKNYLLSPIMYIMLLNEHQN